ncbi:MAG TPA: hypothetical protein PK156_39110, partial [Polyangium sp.]|nr:hypothetical protein [Polyangium sp.]
FIVLLACPEQSAVSQSDADASLETNTHDVKSRAPIVPLPSSEMKSSGDIPVPKRMRADTTARIYHLYRESSVYDFQLELEPAPPRNGNEVRGPKETLTIFRKGTTQVVQRLRISSQSERALNLDYQPTILVNDFNFDAYEDFAIHTGDFGPYGSSTYSVFLFAAASRSFVYSRALSGLTEISLAPLRVDTARRLIFTASKSGCCIHWSEEYEVRRGIPRLMKRETERETPNGRCESTLETRRKDGSMQRKTRQCP